MTRHIWLNFKIKLKMFMENNTFHAFMYVNVNKRIELCKRNTK